MSLATIYHPSPKPSASGRIYTFLRACSASLAFITVVVMPARMPATSGQGRYYAIGYHATGKNTDLDTGLRRYDENRPVAVTPGG